MKKSTLCKMLSTLLIAIFAFGQFGVMASAAPSEYQDVDIDGIVFRIEHHWIVGINSPGEFGEDFHIWLGSLSDVDISIAKVNIFGVDVTDQIESVSFTVDGVKYQDSATLPWFYPNPFILNIKLANGISIEREYTYSIGAVLPK